jgi:hypothetical protein
MTVQSALSAEVYEDRFLAGGQHLIHQLGRAGVLTLFVQVVRMQDTERAEERVRPGVTTVPVHAGERIGPGLPPYRADPWPPRVAQRPSQMC